LGKTSNHGLKPTENIICERTDLDAEGGLTEESPNRHASCDFEVEAGAERTIADNHKHSRQLSWSA
jgi:hypothetical protein